MYRVGANLNLVSPRPRESLKEREARERRQRQQRILDEWFPTIVRYCGVVLTVALTVEAIFFHLEYPSAFIAAAGMILYKTVKKAAGGE